MFFISPWWCDPPQHSMLPLQIKIIILFFFLQPYHPYFSFTKQYVLADADKWTERHNLCADKSVTEFAISSVYLSLQSKVARVVSVFCFLLLLLLFFAILPCGETVQSCGKKYNLWDSVLSHNSSMDIPIGGNMNNFISCMFHSELWRLLELNQKLLKPYQILRGVIYWAFILHRLVIVIKSSTFA